MDAVLHALADGSAGCERSAETRGALRAEDLYDTDIDDRWQACTTPERLARWIARVDGDLGVGGTVYCVDTSR